MLSKLIHGAGLLALATFLGAGGFVGYLVYAGQLTPDRVETMAAVLRGDLDDWEEAGAPDPNAPAPAQDITAGEPTRRSEDEARARRQRENAESLRLERAREDLRAQETLLDQVLLEIEQQREALKEREEVFAERQRSLQDTALDSGFREELSLVSGMKPDTAKDYLVDVWQRTPDMAVRLIMELDERKAIRILERFRTPEEEQIRTDLLEQVRLQGTPQEPVPSGKTGRARQP